MSRNILLHVHIFKNAGSSFDGALQRNFSERFVDHREDATLLEGRQGALERYLKSHPEIQAFSSHSIHFLPVNNEEFHYFPVYFMRHPIDRIRSVYSFEKKQEPAHTQGAKKAKELSFDEYIAWYMQDGIPATIRNIQTIFLSGEGPGPTHMPEKFKIAQKTLEKNLVGVVDRYDESCVVFEEALRPYFPEIDLAYVVRNVTDKNPEQGVEEKAKNLLESMDQRNRRLVQEKNHYDMALYRLANEKLDRAIGGIEDFDKKIEDFLKRCSMLRERANSK